VEVDFEPTGFRWLEANDADGVIAFAASRPKANGPGLCLQLLAGLSSRYRVGLPRGGRWRELLNTDDERYGGGGVSNQSSRSEKPWHDQPFSRS
jgi:1,4-alpha-glucan branching enzyme